MEEGGGRRRILDGRGWKGEGERSWMDGSEVWRGEGEGRKEAHVGVRR